MEWSTLIITEIVRRLPKLLVKCFKYEGDSCVGFEDAITKHLTWVSTWANQIQFYGMSRPEETDTTTIALRVASVPRRFQGRTNGAEELEELEEDMLLEGEPSYILLGDPGAGKTTSLKRLSRKMLTTESVSCKDNWNYPIVLRFRELDCSLVEHLANTVGIIYTVKEVSRSIEVVGKRGRKRQAIQTTCEAFCGERRLFDVLVDTLNSTGAVLLLDGLDEVALEKISPLQKELERLALARNGYKVIVTCRSGDYTRHIEGFNIVEMCPLTSAEVKLLAERWLQNPTEFLDSLRELPFYDLANRPLFLTQLILFFRRYGYLPERPVDVYAKVINLLLEDWDSQRGIYRKSKYAGFTPLRKAEFLAALSYNLTYEAKAKVFSTKMLVNAYKRLCVGFGLPIEEALHVAREIETHTGIIIQGPGDQFEFCHLSLQEYLCASYLSRAPLAEHFVDYLAMYPAPLAIMVALSSDASGTLACLILSPESYREFGYGSHVAFESLVSRLEQEKPYFQKSKYLGLALIRLACTQNQVILKWVDSQIRNNREVRYSFCKAITYYDLIEASGVYKEMFEILRKGYFDQGKDYKVVAPDNGKIPTDIIKFLIEEGDISLGPCHSKRGWQSVSFLRKWGN